MELLVVMHSVSARWMWQLTNIFSSSALMRNCTFSTSFLRSNASCPFLSNVLILAAPYVRVVLQDNSPKLGNGTRAYNVEWMAMSPVQVSSGATIHRFGGCRSDLGSARVYTYCVPSVLRVTTRGRHATAAAILRRQIFSTLQTRETSYPPTGAVQDLDLPRSSTTSTSTSPCITLQSLTILQ
jgi:hypothetical protein